ncbi:MAG: hypothetical protein KF817_08050 [Phycisphaeraceae bacterium]|nr:hypothetical protein [Phycisphaeraceae bacterium]
MMFWKRCVDTECPGPESWRSPGIAGLVALNLVLLAALAAVTWMPEAAAQSRARGRYIMVGGGVNGSAAEAVWLIDTVNEELISITWDPNEREIVGIGGRSIARDLNLTAPAGRGR